MSVECEGPRWSWQLAISRDKFAENMFVITTPQDNQNLSNVHFHQRGNTSGNGQVGAKSVRQKHLGFVSINFACVVVPYLYLKSCRHPTFRSPKIGQLYLFHFRS